MDVGILLETFRRNHRDPVNLAMHAVGFFLLAGSAKRLLTGRLLSALVRGGAGAALLIGGHRIEGTDPFAVMRELRARGSNP